MFPSELESETLELPHTKTHNIVIVTGKELRHQRFALRLLQEFGEMVTAWYELDETVSQKWKAKDEKSTASNGVHTQSKVKRFKEKVFDALPKIVSRHSLSSLLYRLFQFGINLYYKFLLRSTGQKIPEEEKRLFSKEVTELKNKASLTPIKVHPDDLHTDRFRMEIQKLDPYFFLTLSGPLYGKQLLETIRGAAINQHAGHSPLYKGSHTTHWALYHRRLDHVSSTVHITATGADSGQILRRSTPCMFPDDSVETLFLRTVALGTELMIESIHEIIHDKKIQVFIQPKESGRTYLSKEYTLPVAKSLLRDFRSGWLQDELNRTRNY